METDIPFNKTDFKATEMQSIVSLIQELFVGFNKAFQKVGYTAERLDIKIWCRRIQNLLLPLLIAFLENVNNSESSIGDNHPLQFLVHLDEY